MFALAVTNLRLRIGNFLTLTGDYKVENIPNGKVIAARNVQIFLGSPALLEDGSPAPGATGVLVTNARVGIVLYENGPGATDDTFAIKAFGHLSLLGLGDV